jgi:hypothetical protein
MYGWKSVAEATAAILSGKTNEDAVSEPAQRASTFPFGGARRFSHRSRAAEFGVTAHAATPTSIATTRPTLPADGRRLTERACPRVAGIQCRGCRAPFRDACDASARDGKILLKNTNWKGPAR